MKLTRKLCRWLLPLAGMAALTACTGNDWGSAHQPNLPIAIEDPAVAALLEDPAVNLAALDNQGFIDQFGAAPAGFSFAGGELKLEPDAAPVKASATASYIWVANSGEGTISKLNTATGEELGRYRTGPTTVEGSAYSPSWGNPSRTTVDKFGNVWVGNRANNTITKVGLKENNQCIDRNDNGKIDTSTGVDKLTGSIDVKDWTGAWGAAVGSQGSQVEDECILLHVALSADGVDTPTDIRTVAVDASNNLFIGGYNKKSLFKVNGTTGAIIAGKNTLQSHYGGVVDKDGNLWSMKSGSGKVQKTSNDLQTSVLYDIGHDGYGIAIDKYGKVWTTEYGDNFSTFDPANPAGTLQVFTQTDHYGAQGITTDKNGDIFIAGSLGGSSVGHYKQTFNQAGAFTGVSFVANYTVGSGPTGVAVDANGNVWATNTGTDNVSRINLAGVSSPPTDVTVDHFAVGSYPYNYSDMTGAVFALATSKPYGYWEPTIDSKKQGFKWKKVFWQLKEALKDGAIVKFSVKASDSKVALNAMEYVDVQSDQEIPNLVGQYLRIKIYLEANTRAESPIINRIRIY